ncbi:MAG TPA: hypothetical protein VFQ05_01815 [Candidatus Eisenbacteria bacterium]|nr:hypothetical protein [Candidatus Eisenbacteria bacterium]
MTGGLSLATEIRTTDATIALFNLQKQIERLEQQSTPGMTSHLGGELVDRLLLRGQMLGSIADYERASAIGERLGQEAFADGLSFMVRARTRATMHRFKEALDDLDAAERCGHPVEALAVERAAIDQAVGRYDEALALRRDALERRADFESLAGLAVLEAERGVVSEAERLFDESRARFRGVSPFGLAQLDFQRGHLWHGQREWNRARPWYESAVRRVPGYAAAENHLAEIEAAMGERESAMVRLRRLTETSDDPDHAAQLCQLLKQAGRLEESQWWRAQAAARYDELIARHPAAFADHAAAFWLGAGAEPRRALPLARLNAEIRPTPRAQRLLARALAVCESGPPA